MTHSGVDTEVQVERGRLSVTLPYPPTANNMFRHAGGKHFPSKTYEAFKDAAVARLLARMSERGCDTITSDCVVEIAVYMPDRRKRDIDNLVKPILDVMETARVYSNDQLVASITVKRGGVDAENPRAEVVVYAVRDVFCERRVTVFCPCTGGQVDEQEVEVLDISEDIQGRDVLRYKCPVCKLAHESLRRG